MNENILGSFPALNDGAMVHLTPVGANVSVKLPEESVTSHHIGPIGIARINDTAREVLRRCTGAKTLRHIVEELVTAIPAKSGEIDQIMEGSAKFALQAAEYHILTLYPGAAPRPIQVTGSTEYFVPQHISVELTSNCNLRCTYCYREAGPAGAAHLSGAQIIQILSDLKRNGLRSIELTGGEPLLHPAFKDILEFCGRE